MTLGPVPYKIARFDREFKSGEVFFHHFYFPSGPPLYPLDYPLDEILIANILARGKGVEVHGCGVVDAQGKGRLFARSFPPFYSQQGLDFTLSFLEEIVRAIPCYQLKFLPDEEVLGFILKKGHFS
jgi:hypothetical protein